MKNLLAILKAVTAFSGAENHSSTEHNLTTLTNKSEINTSESINNIAREQDHEIDPVNYSVKINISSLDLNPNTGVFNSNEPNAIIETFIRNNADKLDGLTKNDFEVVTNQNNVLTIKVKDDQQKYQGSITINYSVKINI